MAIIYSYPNNTNILGSDLLLITSTALNNNQTKSLSISDLSSYIINLVPHTLLQDLNSVLSTGNTSLLDAAIGKLSLYDNFFSNYASIYADKNKFYFTNYLGVDYGSFGPDTFSFITASGNSFNIKPAASVTAPRTATFQDASGTVAYLSDVNKYKVYTALLTQTGSSAPVATVLENTIGNLVWTRSTGGIYTATLLNAFPDLKTFALNGNALNLTASVSVTTSNGSPSTVSVLTSTDSVLNKTSIEIRVYN